MFKALIRRSMLSRRFCQLRLKLIHELPKLRHLGPCEAFGVGRGCCFGVELGGLLGKGLLLHPQLVGLGCKRLPSTGELLENRLAGMI